jgi:putative transposase
LGPAVIGRPRKLNAEHLERLRRIAAEYPLSTVAELNAIFFRECGIKVSLVTLGKMLREAGLTRVRLAARSGYAIAQDPVSKRYGYTAQHREGGDDQSYATSLTDAEWNLVADVFESTRDGRGKPAHYSRRSVVDACCYVVRTGCAWRLLPKSFPPWNAVYKVFRRWSAQGYFEQMHDRLRSQWRRRAERADGPSVAILDSQSTRTSPQGGIKGFDAGKRIKGRKRNLVVDTMGFLLAVVVTAASVQDRDAAMPAMAQACAKYSSLKTLYVDSAYAGGCATTLQQEHGLTPKSLRLGSGLPKCEESYEESPTRNQT